MTPEQEKYFKAWLKTQMDIGAVSNPIDAERAWEAALLTERERILDEISDLPFKDSVPNLQHMLAIHTVCKVVVERVTGQKYDDWLEDYRKRMEQSDSQSNTR